MTTPNSDKRIAETNPSSTSKPPNCFEEESQEVWLPLQQHNEQNLIPSKFTRVTTTENVPSITSQDQHNGQPILYPQSLTRNMNLIQRALQTNITLKEKLVDHPFSLFGGLFIQHFLVLVWEFNLHVRFGVVLIAIGLVLQTIVMIWNWCQLSTVFIVAVFGGSIIYLAPENIDQLYKNVVEIFTASPARWLDYLHPNQLRNIIIASLLIPTWLELKTLGFLSAVVVQLGWRSNLFVCGVMFFFLSFRTKYYHVTPRDNLKQGVLVLYGLALLLVIYNYRFELVPKVGGPFCLSTGTLLLTLGAWTVMTRHALRLTLRDILATVSQDVQHDEMLQLAMLRWLVDYWSNIPKETSSLPTPTTEKVVQTTSISRQIPTTPSIHSVTSTIMEKNAETASVRAATSELIHEIQWDEMWTMLYMTTKQMGSEIPVSELDSQSQFTSSNNCKEGNRSLRNLNTMLASMDVDLHAKPAVDTYKKMVYSIPPPPHIALAISILRRCPAAIILSWRYLSGSSLALPSTLILLPFVMTEACRILAWTDSCHREAMGIEQPERNDDAVQPVQSVVNLSTEVDTMTILLSGDNYSRHRPPTLLQVWLNMQSSVHALENGLIAARCAQTTAAAADFASHMLSLAFLGLEVKNHGWLHTIAVLVSELVHLQASGGETENTKYTSAAMGVMRNGNIVVNNVHLLSADENIHPAFEPIIGLLSLLAGRGWLWGHDERKGSTESTIEINEITEDSLSQASETKEESKASKTGNSNDSFYLGEGAEFNSCEDDLVSLMESIADTYQRGLISDSEKNSFMVMLSGQNLPRREVVEGIRNSLRYAISNIDLEQEVSATEELNITTQNSTEESPTLISRTSAILGELSQCNSWEVMHDGNDANGETTTLEAKNSIASTHDVISPTSTESHLGRTEEQSRHEQDTGDLIKWVGGGLAIVGAVVGGIAVLNSSTRSDDDDHVFVYDKNDSSVTIEEVRSDDDETDDAWVTVPSALES